MALCRDMLLKIWTVTDTPISTELTMKSVKVLMEWRANQVQTSQTIAVSIASLNRRHLRSYDSVLEKNKVYELYLAIFRKWPVWR